MLIICCWVLVDFVWTLVFVVLAYGWLGWFIAGVYLLVLTVLLCFEVCVCCSFVLVMVSFALTSVCFVGLLVM